MGRNTALVGLVAGMVAGSWGYRTTLPVPVYVWPIPQSAKVRGEWTIHKGMDFAEGLCDIQTVVATPAECRVACQHILGCYGVVEDTGNGDAPVRCPLKSCQTPMVADATVTTSFYMPEVRPILHPYEGLRLTATNYTDTTLDEALSRYSKIIGLNQKGRAPPSNNRYSYPTHLPETYHPVPATVVGTTVDEVQVIVRRAGKLGLGMNENYTVSVPPTGYITIQADTVIGALRGLETLSQMITVDSDGQMVILGADVEDWPEYAHRGMLVDTSRHYLSMNSLKANIDALAYNKMNVLHWHIVDDESFPYVSTTFPELSAKGSYNNVTHIYSPAQVAEIVKYAAGRGIRVVPEFDTPGHTLSWGDGYPDLLTPCYDKNGKPTGSRYGINPLPQATYNFMKQLWEELAGLFPDQYVMLGGDELSFGCWESNPDIQKYLKENGLTVGDLQAQYMNNISKIVESPPLSRHAIVWQEVFDHATNHFLNENTIVAVWKGHGPEELAKVVAAGYKALYNSQWYENYINYGQVWQSYYKVQPRANLSQAQQALVLGGEVSMWGEFVDSTNAVNRLWPASSAAAERLWSSPAMTGSVSGAYPRFHGNRCGMLQRGIRAEPLEGPSFCPHEWVEPYNPPF